MVLSDFFFFFLYYSDIARAVVLGPTETLGEDGTIIRTVGRVRPGRSSRYRRRSTGAPILVWNIYKVVGLHAFQNPRNIFEKKI